jgi:hypothetical protein
MIYYGWKGVMMNYTAYLGDLKRIEKFSFFPFLAYCEV